MAFSLRSHFPGCSSTHDTILSNPNSACYEAAAKRELGGAWAMDAWVIWRSPARTPKRNHVAVRHEPKLWTEMQRVAIARALLVDPKIPVADEPAGNLDKVTGESIMQLFKRLAADKGLAVLITTHHVAFGYER